jgi:hypothetical protein
LHSDFENTYPQYQRIDIAIADAANLNKLLCHLPGYTLIRINPQEPKINTPHFSCGQSA